MPRVVLPIPIWNSRVAQCGSPVLVRMMLRSARTIWLAMTSSMPAGIAANTSKMARASASTAANPLKHNQMLHIKKKVLGFSPPPLSGLGKQTGT